LALELAAVVVICSLIQSVFGVGLLVFGTPALLFLGYPFTAALFHLLPCSILISSLQLKDDHDQARGLLRAYLTALAPAVALGAAIVLLSDRHVNIRPFVGAMLLLSALLRFSDRLRGRLARRLAPNSIPSLAVIGFVHGMTNMGGGLLTAMVNALFTKKTDVRANIALGYWIMAVIQFGLLLALKGPQGSFAGLLLLLALSAVSYLALGRKAFVRSPQLVYQHSMTVLMVVCGVLLLKR
jgi:uncharacterized membrane protein YfcA